VQINNKDSRLCIEKYIKKKMSGPGGNLPFMMPGMNFQPEGMSVPPHSGQPGAPMPFGMPPFMGMPPGMPMSIPPPSM
jgi:hypothetical protein